jgi:Phosphotransferase enzyme family
VLPGDRRARRALVSQAEPAGRHRARPGRVRPAAGRRARRAGVGGAQAPGDPGRGVVVLAWRAAAGAVRIRRRPAAQRPRPVGCRLAERVAGLAAGVHGATGPLGMPVPFTEIFQVWADGLRRCLAELEPGAGRADGSVADARALVRPQRVALLDMQQRVQALGDVARSQPKELVLCHGDLGGDNLLGDRAGRVWLVDWDGAVMAPRERDLAGFAGRGFGRFLAGYRRVAGRGINVERTWSRSSCCAATSRTWSTGWAACSAMISPSSSDSRTSTGCGGACRTGRRWRPASSGPVGCWHGGDAAREPVLVGARWPAWSTGRVDT